MAAARIDNRPRPIDGRSAIHGTFKLNFRSRGQAFLTDSVYSTCCHDHAVALMFCRSMNYENYLIYKRKGQAN